MSIDFGKTAQYYGRHRAGFPLEFFRRAAAWGVGEPGRHLLDPGTGTGTLARGFALQCCRVVGLHPSEPLMEQERALDKQAGVKIDYHVGKAEQTELPAESFDIDQPYSHEGWRGRIRASAGVAASLPPEQVNRFEGELRALLANRFPEEPLQVPHRVFAAMGRRPRVSSA